MATDAFKALSDAKDVLLDRISTKRSAGESSRDCGTDDSDGASTTSKAPSSKRSSKSRGSSKRARDTSDDDGVVRNFIVIISRYDIDGRSWALGLASICTDHYYFVVS